jgi:hypothetical protein
LNIAWIEEPLPARDVDGHLSYGTSKHSSAWRSSPAASEVNNNALV